MTAGLVLPVLVIAGLAYAARASAADTTNPGSTDSEPFHIDKPTLSLETDWFYNSSTIKPITAPGSVSTGTTTATSHDSAVQELLHLSTQGYVIDPSTFTFNLTSGLGMEKLWQKEEGVRSSQVLALDDYDVLGTLGPTSDSPLTVHANRTTELTSQPFSETYQSVSNNYDASLTLSSHDFNTLITAFHTDLAQTSPAGLDNFRYSQNGAQINSSGTLATGQRLSFDYGFHGVQETDAQNNTYNFDINSTTLSLENDFGEHFQHSLTSTISDWDQTGDFAQQRFRLDEDLLLHHSDQFETFYQYQLENTQYPQVVTTLNRLQAGARSRLFSNFYAVGTVGGLTQDQSGAATGEYYARLDVDYHHAAPLGLISSTLNLSLDQQNNQAQNVPAYVTTDATFDSSQQLILPHTGIQQNSIGVRDTTGTRTYFASIDYTTVYKSNRAIIQRIPGGAIPANSAVLINYTVAPQPANDVATDGLTAGVRYDIKEGFAKGLSLYTRYFIQQQDTSSDQPGAFIADNVNALTYGAEYRIWRLLFSAEHEDHRSDLFPYHSNRFGARYEGRIGQDWRFFADAAHVQTWFDDDKTHFGASTLTGDIDYRLAPDLFADFLVEYIRISGDAASNERGWDEELSIKKVMDDLTLKGAIRHSDLIDPTQDSSFLYLYFSAERKL
jgi:hypothetical protein